MQRFSILHRTYYNFSAPVILGPHQLRLRPREDHELRIESSRLNITPAGPLRWYRDVEGNSIALADFSTPTTQLAIESEVIIQQYNQSPLDFVVADYAVAFPFRYLEEDQALLSPYMKAQYADTDSILGDWVAGLRQRGAAVQSYALLQRLTDAIHSRLSYQSREQPGVQSLRQTLERGSGSCRDFACLFIEAARFLGLAARFVSGYLYSPPSVHDYGVTHAWAEVYLPGAGWKGFDPTTGGLVGSDHIAVAVARLPESVPPAAGSFSGAAASELDVGVWLTPLPR